MNVTPQVWRSDDDVHVMDQRITLSLIGMDIDASSMTEILLHAGWSLHLSLPVSLSSSTVDCEEVAEIVNLWIHSYLLNLIFHHQRGKEIVLQGTSFCPVWTAQPLTLAPPSAAVTELQVISHASLLWAWDFSLAQWTKLNSAGLHSFVTLWVAGFVWPFSQPSAYTSSRFGWTELKH